MQTSERTDSNLPGSQQENHCTETESEVLEEEAEVSGWSGTEPIHVKYMLKSKALTRLVVPGRITGRNGLFLACYHNMIAWQKSSRSDPNKYTSSHSRCVAGAKAHSDYWYCLRTINQLEPLEHTASQALKKERQVLTTKNARTALGFRRYLHYRSQLKRDATGRRHPRFIRFGTRELLGRGKPSTPILSCTVS